MSECKLEFSDDSWSWKRDKLFDYVYFKGCMPYYYKDFFSQPDVVREIKTISDILFRKAHETAIYPSMENVFRAFKVGKPKVVIIGIDPYHDGTAVGLSFSLSNHAKYINPSLRGIQNEVAKNGFQVDSTVGDLSRWMNEGVFLLNAALTVEEAVAGSHINYWKKFTSLLINYLSLKYELAWALWGTLAQEYEDDIIQPDVHYIITTSHFTPLAAMKNINGIQPFSGSNCFIKINKWLKYEKKGEIDWQIP